MTKKKTIKEKQLEKLLQRVGDMYDGACGYVLEDYSDWVNPEDLAKVMPVMRDTFLKKDEKTYLFGCHNIHHFQSPRDAAEFLYSFGVRA